MKEIKTFLIKGKYRVKTDLGYKVEKFNKKVKANSKKAALEKVHSLIGSHHGVKRRFIHVKEVEEVD